MEIQNSNINTSPTHVMSDHFKHVLRGFRQAVMDAKSDVLQSSDADEWRQKKLRQHHEFIQQTFLGCGQLALPLSVMGALVSFAVGHSVFDSGGAGVLIGGTLGLGVGGGLLLKREMIEQQLAARHEDVQHFLQTLQPLRASAHCREVLHETTALLHQGTLGARCLERLQHLSKQMVAVYHEDVHQQIMVERNQQLMTTLLDPLPLTEVEVVAHSKGEEAAPNRHHLQL